MIYVIEEVIKTCTRCRVVDKPYVKYEVYRKYVPSKVKLLIISESPPPGLKEDFIYNLSVSDRLRSVLKKLFNLTYDEDLIKLFMFRGIFWTTAIKCRPVSKKYLEYMRKNCTHILKLEIELLKPNNVLGLGKTSWKSLEELNVNFYKHYHPLYLHRFRRELLPKLRKLIISLSSD